MLATCLWERDCRVDNNHPKDDVDDFEFYQGWQAPTQINIFVIILIRHF